MCLCRCPDVEVITLSASLPAGTPISHPFSVTVDQTPTSCWQQESTAEIKPHARLRRSLLPARVQNRMHFSFTPQRDFIGLLNAQRSLTYFCYLRPHKVRNSPCASYSSPTQRYKTSSITRDVLHCVWITRCTDENGVWWKGAMFTALWIMGTRRWVWMADHNKRMFFNCTRTCWSHEFIMNLMTWVHNESRTSSFMNLYGNKPSATV